MALAIFFLHISQIHFQIKSGSYNIGFFPWSSFTSWHVYWWILFNKLLSIRTGRQRRDWSSSGFDYVVCRHGEIMIYELYYSSLMGSRAANAVERPFLSNKSFFFVKEVLCTRFPWLHYDPNLYSGCLLVSTLVLPRIRRDSCPFPLHLPWLGLLWRESGRWASPQRASLIPSVICQAQAISRMQHDSSRCQPCKKRSLRSQCSSLWIILYSLWLTIQVYSLMLVCFTKINIFNLYF